MAQDGGFIAHAVFISVLSLVWITSLVVLFYKKFKLLRGRSKFLYLVYLIALEGLGISGFARLPLPVKHSAGSN
jgi:hypothetical protein